jgi:hypothetical protein
MQILYSLGLRILEHVLTWAYFRGSWAWMAWCPYTEPCRQRCCKPCCKLVEIVHAKAEVCSL